jgi:hypothetical protein
VSCWSSNNSYNLPIQQIHVILYEHTHTKFYNFYILRLLSLAIASTLLQIVLIVSSQSVYISLF